MSENREEQAPFMVEDLNKQTEEKKREITLNSL